MPAEVMDNWYKTGRSVILKGIPVKPAGHKMLKGKPLSSQKGQAEAFFLTDDKGNWWILKKFHNTCNLDCIYLKKVSSLLPKDPAFICGTNRKILSKGVLVKTKGYYFSKDLDHWLDGTVLMPKVNGLDWAAVADEIRDGTILLDRLQRITLCKNLTRLVQLLESSNCCHRDLSCGNIFIDIKTGKIYLIDFDSLYHPTLCMPQATTCGTVGYTAHHAWHNGKLIPRRTWCQYIDRYAMALLNTEFLLVQPGTRFTGEGGIFAQEELKTQSGKGIDSVITELKAQYPHAAQLLQSTIRSSSFSECPSPKDWNSFFSTVTGSANTSPKLDDTQDVPLGHIEDILNRCRGVVPPWSAPSLQDISKRPLQIFNASQVQAQAVSLPPDPWAKKPTTHETGLKPNTRRKPWVSFRIPDVNSSYLNLIKGLENGFISQIDMDHS